MEEGVSTHQQHVPYDGGVHELEYFIRTGKKRTWLYLHGLGCSKGDFFSAAKNEKFDDYTLVAFDFPGHGGSNYSRLVEVNDLVDITHGFINELKRDDIVLIGHSLGGLVGLLLAEKHLQSITAFVDIEGNLHVENCHFSSAVADVSFDEFQGKTLPGFLQRLHTSENTRLKPYANSREVLPTLQSSYDCCPSPLFYSENGDLVERYAALTIPKLYVYGSENNGFSFLPRLRQKGCDIREIPKSNQFPLQDNPQFLFKVRDDFLQTSTTSS